MSTILKNDFDHGRFKTHRTHTKHTGHTQNIKLLNLELGIYFNRNTKVKISIKNIFEHILSQNKFEHILSFLSIDSY